MPERGGCPELDAGEPSVAGAETPIRGWEGYWQRDPCLWYLSGQAALPNGGFAAMPSRCIERAKAEQANRYPAIRADAIVGPPKVALLQTPHPRARWKRILCVHDSAVT